MSSDPDRAVVGVDHVLEVMGAAPPDQERLLRRHPRVVAGPAPQDVLPDPMLPRRVIAELLAQLLVRPEAGRVVREVTALDHVLGLPLGRGVEAGVEGEARDAMFVAQTVEEAKEFPIEL